jgi:hypothetical protein
MGVFIWVAVVNLFGTLGVLGCGGLLCSVSLSESLSELVSDESTITN